MNIVDSSGWLEYFADGPNADFFAPAIEAVDELVVPSISIFEVFKWILRQRSDDEALQAIAVMQQGQVANLDSSVALTGAKLSLSLGLPMATA
jgi:predicted nucleic acid-binding protein